METKYINNIYITIHVPIFTKIIPTCLDCQRREAFVDLRGIGPNGYSTGERIIGNIETLGWVVARGVQIEEPSYKEIKRVARLGRSFYG